MTAQATNGIAPFGDETRERSSLRRRLRVVVDLRHAARNLIEHFRAALDAIETERRRREMIRDLQLLDDWMLADIGLKRDEIESAVRGERPAR
jgi:uncharacterized protein YjiS (DUF1127 family)